MKNMLAVICILITCSSFGQTFSELTTSAAKAEKEKSYREAIDLYNKALDLDHGNYFIYNKLALMYNQLGQMDSAIIFCNLTLQKIPNDSMALYYRGHCYMDKGEYRKAAGDFTMAFENTGKKNADVCFNIGKCYSGLNEYNKAIEYFKLTLTLEPEDKFSFYELGVCYASFTPPDKAEALKYYNKAIEKDGNYYQPYFNRGLLYAVQFKDLKKAHQDLERSIEIRSKNKLSYLYNGMLYRDEKEYGKARDMYNKVIEIYPDYAEAYFERAVAWYGIGILNMVCKDLDKAESLGNKDAIEYKKKVCK